MRNKQIEVVYATFHVDVGETPFFISVDFTKRVIVITIRGTLSMKDIITDLSAESELIPLQNINHNWKGHKVNTIYSTMNVFYSNNLSRNSVLFLLAEDLFIQLRSNNIPIHVFSPFYSIFPINKLYKSYKTFCLK